MFFVININISRKQETIIIQLFSYKVFQSDHYGNSITGRYKQGHFLYKGKHLPGKKQR